MVFPPSERVIYDNNPLDMVLCQVRFPSILIIDREPVEFQEKVRHFYPVFRERREQDLPIPPQIHQQLPAELKDLFVASKNNGYDFISLDEVWGITLTRDYLALTNKQYQRWEEFHHIFAQIAHDSIRSCK